MTIMGIAGVLCAARDLPRARAFYEDLLGLTPTRVFGPEGDRLVQYQPGGFTLTLVPAHSPLARAAGSGGVSFTPTDFEAALRELRRAGVTVLLEPVESPLGRLAIVLDPEGNRVVLREREPDLSGPAVVHQ